jgi:hypothetical protein
MDRRSNEHLDWRLIFQQSPANECRYDEQSLPMHVWAWPQDTWLKKRTRELREEGKSRRPGTITVH